MTNTPWPPKAPADVLPYGIFWEDDLGLDTVITSVATATGVTIDSQGFTPTTSFVTLSGGTSGVIGVVSFVITTAGSLTITRDMQILISDQVEQLAPTTQTKQTIVEMAFEEIGLAGYEFDATPEETYSALRRLDALMSEWKGPGVGISIGYNFPLVFGGGLLTDPSGIPDEAVNTVAIFLALRIMPSIGKTMSPETQRAMTRGYNALLTTCAVIPERVLQRGTPRGAGNKPFSTWNPYGGWNSN